MISVPFHYTVFDTTLGHIGLIGLSAGLLRVIVGMPKDEMASLMIDSYPGVTESLAGFGDLPDRICRYLGGERILFDDAVDWSGVSGFSRAVLEAAHVIPYGEVRSYGWLARHIGRPHAARAVGQALAHNPVPIVVPCHRVVGSDGRLIGFTGGLEMKRRLQEMEAASK